MTESVPSVTSRDRYKYTVVDPFHNTAVYNTETQGRLPVGTTDYITLNNPETAAEIKTKAPWNLVTPTPQKVLDNGRVGFVQGDDSWKRRPSVVEQYRKERENGNN